MTNLKSASYYDAGYILGSTIRDAVASSMDAATKKITGIIIDKFVK